MIKFKLKTKAQQEKEYTLYFKHQQTPMVACINPVVNGGRLISKQYHVDLFVKNVALCLEKLPESAFQGLAEKVVQ